MLFFSTNNVVNDPIIDANEKTVRAEGGFICVFLHISGNICYTEIIIKTIPAESGDF